MSADEPAVPEIPEAEKKLLEGFDRRMKRGMFTLGVAGVAGFWWWSGAGGAAGFAIGATLSALSFVWMKNAISVLADAAASGREPSPRRSSGAVARFVLRFALIGVAGYVIFLNSAVSLGAFFAGLFLAVAALFAEIAYQLYRSFRSA